MSSKLQSSGPISAQDIKNVFGETGSGQVSFGNFRNTTTVGEMNNLPVSEGIPTGSSSISFNDFYNKRLTIVVRYHNESRPNTGYQRFNGGTGDVVVIRPSGGNKGVPNSSSGCRVILHVEGQVTTSGSERNQRYRCALRTGGAWESDTRLEVNVGGEGEIVGGGGDGGAGSSNEDENGANGQPGSSGLGVAYTLYSLTVQSGGEIRAGGGGGGGGGCGREDSATDRRRGGGGGGGGGAGVPAGRGGSTSEPEGPGGGRGGSGGGGSTRQGGVGGNGGDNDSEAFGGGGGGGGAPGAEDGEGGEGGEEGNAEDGGSGSTGVGDGGKGGNGKGRDGESNGGAGGFGGFAYVVKSGSTIERFSGGSRIDGNATTGYTGDI